MNKIYSIAYKLYTITDGVRDMEEEAPASDPFIFISGFGTTIPGFESHIADLDKGAEFNFTLSKAEAYGERYDERVIDLDKQIFTIDGKFDDKHIQEGAIIPLQNEDGNRFMGQVVSIGDTTVRIDLNHPLAGCELNFVGSVIDCREATNEEIQQMINSLNGGCGGGCGNCSGGCDNCGGDEKKDGCSGENDGCGGGCGHCK